MTIRILSLSSSSDDLREVNVGGDLECWQSLVSGPIDVVDVGENIDMVINDEGLATFPPTLVVQRLGWVPIHGPVVFVGHDGEGGHVGLTDAQIASVRRRFKRVSGFARRDTGEIIPSFIEVE